MRRTLGLLACVGLAVGATAQKPMDADLPLEPPGSGGPVSPSDTGPLDPGCPGAGLDYVEATVTTQGVVECSAEFSLTVGGVTYTNGERGCPLYATINPAHTRVVADPGSGMQAQPAGFTEAKVIRFGCKFRYFMFIEWDHHCVEASTRTAGMFPTFTLAPCGAKA
jgi:hypothetical protein